MYGSVPFRSVPAVEKKKRLRRKSKSEPLRCFHCGVTNTLHWRYGPNGKNTLCNVRRRICTTSSPSHPALFASLF